MRKLFFKKQMRVEQAFEEFLGCLERSIELFTTGMFSYLEHGIGESFEKSSELVNGAESKADKIRMDIGRALFRDELLPDSRGDLLRLLESCDKVANRTEAVINNICLRRVIVPRELADDVKEMLVPVQTSVETLVTGVRLLFRDPDKAIPAAQDVGRLETESDKLEHALIRRIYGMDLDLAMQIQLERVIADLGSIADRAEDAAITVEIVAIKRML